jgi:hypothetical protein
MQRNQQPTAGQNASDRLRFGRRKTLPITAKPLTSLSSLRPSGCLYLGSDQAKQSFVLGMLLPGTQDAPIWISVTRAPDDGFASCLTKTFSFSTSRARNHTSPFALR